MKITLEQAGKKYYREWIFRWVSMSISSNEKIAILGPNGSGKSTLLQILSGAVMLSEGKISYNDGQISDEAVYLHLTMAAPYLELIDEFTLSELMDFHFKFKKPLDGLSKKDVLELSGLSDKKDSVFRYFSSGMKQRIKLSLALLSESKLVLLDEPCSNLDASAIQWYNELISRYASGRTIIVASNNQENEFSFCTRSLYMTDLKNVSNR